MPHNKVFPSADEALAGIRDGAVVMVAGDAGTGIPHSLLEAVVNKGVGGLTCICGGLYGRDQGPVDAARLVSRGRVKKLITVSPIDSDSAVTNLRERGDLEIEVVPHGTLAERVRAGGAGLGGLFLPPLPPEDETERTRDGEETLLISGREYVMETPLRADFALLRAHTADTLGNLVYRRAQRNWNPIMAMSAHITIVEVDHIVEPGDLDPELVITPGIYVDRIVPVGKVGG